MKTRDRAAESGGASAGDDYLPGSGNGGYSVSHYALDLDYKVSSNRLTGTAVITASASRPLGRFSLDLVGLVASKVSVDGVRAAKSAQNAQKLTITPARPIEAGASFIVTVRYGGSPGPRKTPWGEVGWEELAEGVIVAGQPSGAATWFPCNDHPGDKATMRLTVTADSPYRVVANGVLVSQTVKSSRTRWVFETVEPMATYLATVQIGYYQPYALPPARIQQHAYIPEDLAVEFGSDFAGQPAMIEKFEELFGEFPFSEYTVVVTDDDLEIPLEAHGLSVFGRNHVNGHQGEVRLIAHELAHSWFGNSLTAESWKHIWLHEGFACYAEWLWSEASGAQSADRLAELYWNRLNALPQDFPIGDPGPEFMFDDRLYKRGALTLHALRRTIGSAAFFAMLKEWTRSNRHGSVTTEQFLAHVGESSDRPTGPLLAAWLFDPALPRLPAKRR